MNKVVKGTIAAAAAVALFGGGAGSLAYWQASASTENLTLQMGHVEIRTSSSSNAYTLNGNSISRSEVELKRLVPGDTVTFEQYFTVDIGGTDAVLRVAELDFGSTSSAVMDAIETSVTVVRMDGEFPGFEFSATNEARAYNITGFGAVKTVVTISVPASLEDDESMVNGIFLQPVPVTVTQVTEPLPDAVG